MSNTTHYINLEDTYGARNYDPLPIVLHRGKGVWLYDTEGRRYLDCLSAYSAVNQGHCHPEILGALQEQAARLTLTSRAFLNDQLGPLYQDIHQLTGMEMILMMNSGAEAVETAIKVARRWGYTIKGVPDDRAEIVVCANNFHGRTTTLVSFSTEQAYRRAFGPFTPGFTVIPFGDAESLRLHITPNTCGFLVEPIQGEAGVILPPDGYLSEVERICREHQVLFMVDEIQSGLGRTGNLFAHMHDAVKPDLVMIGKALSGGFYPISAVLGSREVLGLLQPGDHGSTFGGNPLACAVARAALRVLTKQGLIERARVLGEYFLQALRSVRHPSIVTVRGGGLWIALELSVPARPYCEALSQTGLLCRETHDTVIRFAPPLVISREEIDWAVDKIRTVFQQSQLAAVV